MSLPVIILAGSRDGERDPLAQFGNVSHKAVLPVGGIPMIERVITTLEKIPGLGPFFVCIEKPECLGFLKGRVTILPAAASPSETVSLAVEQISTPCLVTTADHALLQPQWVEEFLEKSHHSEADLTAGIALAPVIERDVPGTKRTYIRLSDTVFSGCNLFFLAHPKAIAVIDFWKHLQKNRKHPLRMALTLGIGTLFLAVAKKLSRKDVEHRIKRLTQADVSLIPLSDGRAAVDVDKVADVHLVESLLSAP